MARTLGPFEVNRIHEQEALEGLRLIPSASVDLVIADPPYILGVYSHKAAATSKNSPWGDLMNASVWFAAWYREVRRILKPSGSFWTFLNWRTQPTVTKAALDAGFVLDSLVVWDRCWFGPGGERGVRPQYELLAIMGADKLAIKNRAVSDVWRCKWTGNDKPHGHRAEKPQEIVGRILDLFPGALLVVDPFAGSGTVSAECRARGIDCVAFEMDASWVEKGNKRLDGLTVQETLGLPGEAA